MRAPSRRSSTSARIRLMRWPDELRSERDGYVLSGRRIYIARILKGAQPAELPVQQSTKVELGHQPQDRKNARSHLSDQLLAAPTR